MAKLVRVRPSPARRAERLSLVKITQQSVRNEQLNPLNFRCETPPNHRRRHRSHTVTTQPTTIKPNTILIKPNYWAFTAGFVTVDIFA